MLSSAPVAITITVYGPRSGSPQARRAAGSGAAADLSASARASSSRAGAWAAASRRSDPCRYWANTSAISCSIRGGTSTAPGRCRNHCPYGDASGSTRRAEASCRDASAAGRARAVGVRAIVRPVALST